MERKKEEIYHQITNTLTDGETRRFSVIGLCRVWSKHALDAIEVYATENDISIAEIEAREVEIEPNLYHTFVFLKLDGDQPFLFDGTGLANKEPYFGYEEDAPDHLQNSHPDLINHYR